MKSTHAPGRDISAPVSLGLDTRTDFRKAAIALLDAMPEGSGCLTIDLTLTRHVDSAGLGVLMLVQHRAAERRLSVMLRNPNDDLRFLLLLTKLDTLFEVDVHAR